MLAVDVGNSEIDVALFDNLKQQATWALPTTTDYTTETLKEALLGRLELSHEKIDEVIISSVVQELNPVLEEVFSGCKQKFIDHKSHFSFSFANENLRKAGNDRLANIEALFRLYSKPAIAVDFGTATTLSALSKEGAFIGGAIAPGLMTAFNALHTKASGLRKFDVDLKPPGKIIGEQTTEALGSGTLVGHAIMVDGLVTRFKKEIGDSSTKVVATGGFASRLKPHLTTIEYYDEHLTLKGVALIGTNKSKRVAK